MVITLQLHNKSFGVMWFMNSNWVYLPFNVSNQCRHNTFMRFCSFHSSWWLRMVDNLKQSHDLSTNLIENSINWFQVIFTPLSLLYIIFYFFNIKLYIAPFLSIKIKHQKSHRKGVSYFLCREAFVAFLHIKFHVTKE